MVWHSTGISPGTLIIPTFYEWILHLDTMSQIPPLSHESFFMPLWRAIENSSWAGSRQEAKLQKKTTKSKEIVLSIVKNNGKEGLKLSKVRKEEKWLAQIFRKDFTETKLEITRTRIKIMLSTSLSLVFSHKVHNIRFEKQICILS